MTTKVPPKYEGNLRRFSIKVPEVIRECSGIVIFGKRIKSLVFSTDLSVIRNINADAIFAVYTFTPQPVINDALLMAADIPVFTGVGGGLTQGDRVIDLARSAEHQGAIGVVLNAPTKNAVVTRVKNLVDLPVVLTIGCEGSKESYQERIDAGVDIFNVSGGAQTAQIVQNIRDNFPDFPIIATGGPTEQTIIETIQAGANAITYTPPSNGEIFKDIMAAYRQNLAHPEF